MIHIRHHPNESPGADFQSWPGRNDITSDKVPSELAYVGQSTSSRTKATKRYASGVAVTGALADGLPSDKVVWGYGVRPGQTPLRYLKLLLDPRQKFPSFFPKYRLLEQLSRLNKTPTEAISHYLSLLHDEAKEALIRRYGEREW